MKTSRKVRIKKANTDKEVYEYALKNLELKHASKKHLEIKGLSVLQACAFSIALFTALLAYSDNLPESCKVSILVLKLLFYFFTLLSILCMLISLDDAIANRLKKGSDGLYQDSLEAKCLYYKNKRRFAILCG